MPSISQLLLPFLDAAILVPILVLFTRLVGLRSFSKMSGYDFAITVAMGSVLASVVVSKSTGWMTGAAALAALFVVQVAISRLRVEVTGAEEVLDNDPLLIMEGETIYEENMRAAKISHADLFGKLREANVLRLSQVQAVIFEPTGDVSVLHGEGPIDEMLMKGIRRS